MLENIFGRFPKPQSGREYTDYFYFQGLPKLQGRVRVGFARSNLNRLGPVTWYDQDEEEFVMLLKGSAELFFDEGNQEVHMKPGDYITIPAHAKHKISRTSDDAYLLTIFYQPKTRPQ